MSSNTPPVPPEGITYYDLFGVEENASTEKIEKQYRRLVRMYHPDQCDLDNAEEIIKRVHTAREVLTNPRKRQSYDRQGHEMYTGEPLQTNTSTTGSEKSVSIGTDGKIFNASWMRDTDTQSNTEHDTESDDGVEKINLDEPPGESDSWDFDDLFDEEQEVTDEDIKSVDKKKTTNETNKSYQDEVAAQSKSRQRKVKFSQARNKSSNDTTQTDEKTINESKSTSQSLREKGQSVYNGFDETLDYIESFFRDDVISTAVRRAWIARFSITVVAFTVYLLIGVALNTFIGSVPFFPSLENITTTPESQLPVLIGITVIVFIVDQYKTENDVSKGKINASQLPIKLPILGLLLYTIATVLYVTALSFESQPIEYIIRLVFTLEQPTMQVWHSMFIVDALLALVMISGILVGYAITIPALTRHIWYDRYVNGYSVLPVIWDTLLALPVLVFLWATLTRIEILTVPGTVGTFFTATMGPLADVLGITMTSIPMSAIIGFVLLTPLVLIVFYTLRHILSLQLAD